MTVLKPPFHGYKVQSIHFTSSLLPSLKMASASRALLFFLLSSTLLHSFPTISAASDKVSLSLFYEALCPFCSTFIVNSLSRILSNGLISIVDLRLVPFGNAQIGSHSSISCQHGAPECFFNTVEACAINAWPDVQQHFSFILCVEKLVVENNYNDWESCFQRTGLNSHPLVDCYNDGHGQEIELQYATETIDLQPPKRYVPWVVVNGLPLYDEYDNFETYVCNAYQGELPIACQRLPPKIPQTNKISPSKLDVCYG